MSNFTVHFQNAWLLFLLIPALVLTLIPYFRSAKKYRRNRNRIVSIVLHMLVMTLAIFVISGMTFSYEKSNVDNEVLLLVDVSDSGDDVDAERDRFVRDALDDSNGDCRIGVVTFGKEPVYAAELTTDPDRAYRDYASATLPDRSATDIATALGYARTLFSHPETAKIVVISDGIETDKNALSVIKTVAADGIRVDAVHIAPQSHGDEVQLTDIVLPEYNIVAGTPFDLGVTVQSSYVGDATITVFDNGQPGNSREVKLLAGLQTFNIEHTMYKGGEGMHEIAFTITSDGDTLSANNRYCTYVILEAFDRILVLERADESARISGLFGDDYNLDVVNVFDEDAMPKTLDALRQYDQVILNNIANEDMPTGFDEILHSYVHDIGGGLLTVGGNRIENGDTVANAYNREDMYGTLYQQMLPVQAVDYTPPLGLMIVIDKSQSMNSGGGIGATGNYLAMAKSGAIACLDTLSERDWCGVMSLSDDVDEDIVISPMTQKGKIVSAINAIQIDSSTVFTGAIIKAGEALRALTGVEKKHIILVTDGNPGDTKPEYEQAIKDNYASGITMSIINIGSSGNPDMQYAAEALGGGRFYGVVNLDGLADDLRADLSAPEIKDVNYGPFTPEIKDHTAAVNGVNQEFMPQLHGFYGTKLKEGADVPLMGEYVPVYAQWKYGEGTVGSFMCDLAGIWSEEFLANDTGIRFLKNVVGGLFPTHNIRPRDIDAEITDDNYTKQINVFTSLADDEVIEVRVTNPIKDDDLTDPRVQVMRSSASEGYNRITFTVDEAGVYQVLIQKKDAAENVISEYLTYKAFSYSDEYDVFVETDGKEFLERMATNGNGALVEESAEIFENFVKSIVRTVDPRLAFLIIAIVLFLLDIAVRKFKFKWPHEIVREYRENKALKGEK